MEIYFHFEDIEPIRLSKPEITSWLSTIAKEEKRLILLLNYIFCSDEYLLEVNQDYLEHDYYTDIITFDNSETNEIEGDIFISVERIKENSQSLKTTFENELMRVMVHGVLHLFGYRDKSTDEEKIMRSKEDAYLSLLKI